MRSGGGWPAAARRRARLASALVALSVAAVAAAGERVVAVADVHGSFDGLSAILRQAGLVDEELRWSGGDATLVQLGDLLDRGVRVREVMDLLIRLQREAPKAGGRVVCLLGNHEGMNLLGILKDVDPGVFEGFADDESEGRRSRAWRAQTRAWRRRADLFGLGRPLIGPEVRARWEAGLPLGALEYLEALGPNGGYGAWLRSNPIAFRTGGTLFVHAGVSPDLPEREVAGLNSRVASELVTFDHVRGVLAAEGLVLPTAAVSDVAQVAGQVLRTAPEANGRSGAALRRLAAEIRGIEGVEDWYLISSEGPLWFRGAADGFQEHPDEALLEVVDEMAVERMVVGHTPRTAGRIEARLGGRVLLADTGMLSSHYTGGRPSAVELEDGVVTAIYPDGRFRLTESGWQPVAPAAAPAASPAVSGAGATAPPP